MAFVFAGYPALSVAPAGATKSRPRANCHPNWRTMLIGKSFSMSLLACPLAGPNGPPPTSSAIPAHSDGVQVARPAGFCSDFPVLR